MSECNLSLRVLPRVEGGKNASYAVVDRVLEYIRSTGVSYYTGPSDTTLEGNLDELLAILGEAQKICLKEGAESVYTLAQFSYSSGDLSFQERLDRTAAHRKS